MTMFISIKRLVLVTSAVFALVLVVSCGQPVATVPTVPTVPTVAPAPVIVAPVAPEVPQAIQELAAPEAAPPVVDVDQPAATDVSAPCAAGQLKGNDTSHIFHAPGQLAYAKTHAHVTCFDTVAQAQAAGYRAAKR